MNRQPPSLRRRIALVVIIVAALGAGLAGWLGTGIARSQMQEAQRRTQALVMVVASEVELFLRQPAENLTTLAMAKFAPDEVMHALEDLRRYTPIFKQTLMLNEMGTVVAASPSGSYLGLDLSRHPAFLAAQADQGLQWCKTSRSIDTGSPEATIAMRCPGGVLVGTFDLGRLAEMASTRISMGAGGFVAVLDRAGTVIAHSDAKIALQGWTFASLKPVAQILAGRSQGEEVRWQGRTGIATGTRVTGSGWSVVAFHPSDEAIAQGERLRWTVMVAIAGTGMVMAWLIYLLTMRLLRPIGSLVQAASSLAEGGTAVVPTPYVELAGTVGALNELAIEVRQREASLRASENNLRITLDSIGDGVIATDAKGRITRLNPVAEVLCGWPQADAQGKDLAEVFRIINASTRGSIPNPVDKVLASGQVVGLGNHTVLQARDGREYQIADSAAPIRDQDGTIRGVVLVFRDVTHEYELEDRLRHAQKMDAIGQLAGGVAHDFNNMLTAIVGGCDLLDTQPPPEARQRALSLIRDGASRAADLTRKLLSFARKNQTQITSVDLPAILRANAALLERTVDRRIRIILEIENGPCSVRGDASLLQSALLNLGVNARDAMPEGGTITYNLRRVPGPARDGDGDTQHAELRICDTGSGIPADILPRIFEPFFTTKEVGKGTGLGLSVVYSTIKDHGGRIEVASIPGQGTLFTIHLPLDGNAPAEPATNTVKIQHGHGTVLIIEDEPMLRHLAQSHLGYLGYRVLLAEDGITGSEMFQAHRNEIDVVMLDMVMPGLSGQETFQLLRAIDPGVPVLICSGYDRAGAIDDLLNQGACGLVQKPYTLADLSQALSRAIRPRP